MADKHPKSLRPSTAVLHRGFDPKLSVGSARPAVFRASTYVFSTPEKAERAFKVALGEPARDGEEVELIYSRLSHPNAEILEAQIIALEPGAEAASVFASGMSAIATLLFTFLKPGDKFIYTVPSYGGTHHLIKKLIKPLGIHGIPCSAGDTEKLMDLVCQTENLKLVFIETPSNPTLVMTDIGAAVRAAEKCNVKKPLVAVDNTFMGPTFQHPLTLGADFTVYSATKYLAGFSDMTGGVIMAKNPDYIEATKGTRAVLGTILSPDESWLLDSRLPTVELRMNRQSKSAERLVNQLVGHPKIERMGYPGLITDPEQKRIRDLQCEFPGGIFTFELKGGKEAAFNFLRKIRLAKMAVSLGGMESLICHPATTVSSEMDAQTLREAQVTDGLLRVSVGLEDWQDLAEDFKRTLDEI